MKATKKQMVDFLNEYGVFGGKKVPKYELNSLTEEELVNLISKNPDFVKLFEEYVAVDNASKAKYKKWLSYQGQPDAERTKVDEEYKKEFLASVDDFVKNPEGKSEMINFLSCLETLPPNVMTKRELGCTLKPVVDKLFVTGSKIVINRLQKALKKRGFK